MEPERRSNFIQPVARFCECGHHIGGVPIDGRGMFPAGVCVQHVEQTVSNLIDIVNDKNRVPSFTCSNFIDCIDYTWKINA
jgi:hypothetical protein